MAASGVNLFPASCASDTATLVQYPPLHVQVATEPPSLSSSLCRRLRTAIKDCLSRHSGLMAAAQENYTRGALQNALYPTIKPAKGGGPSQVGILAINLLGSVL